MKVFPRRLFLRKVFFLLLFGSAGAVVRTIGTTAVTAGFSLFLPYNSADRNGDDDRRGRDNDNNFNRFHGRCPPPSGTVSIRPSLRGSGTAEFFIRFVFEDNDECRYDRDRKPDKRGPPPAADRVYGRGNDIGGHQPEKHRPFELSFGELSLCGRYGREAGNRRHIERDEGNQCGNGDPGSFYHGDGLDNAVLAGLFRRQNR